MVVIPRERRVHDNEGDAPTKAGHEMPPYAEERNNGRLLILSAEGDSASLARTITARTPEETRAVGQAVAASIEYENSFSDEAAQARIDRMVEMGNEMSFPFAAAEAVAEPGCSQASN